MKNVRSLGCAIALGFLVLVGIALWVGARVGTATSNASPATGASAVSASPLGQFFPHSESRQGHGAIGLVESVEPYKLTIRNRDGQRVVVVSQDTLVLKGGERPSSTSPTVGADGLTGIAEIRPGARIVAIGKPGPNGELEARAIRIGLPDRKEKPDP
ncbi:MAG: hypothetical protein U0641_03945 [Anaerolineae bacterium]